MAKFFIDHPRFAAVISIVITLMGILSALSLPISQYPEIAPPEITVNAVYPGANATTVRDTVGAVLEREINGVEDMIYMKSTSANDGTYTLVVTFEVGADGDKAQTLVQNRVNKALPNVPEDVRRQGISVEKESSTILQAITLQAPGAEEKYDDLFLANYATLNIRDSLLRVPGVGKVQVLNELDYAARIWLDPIAMTNLDVSVQDVIAAIGEQNIVAAAGQIGALPTGEDQKFQLTLQVKGRMESPEEFADIILRAYEDGRLLYLRSVARLELGAKNYYAKGKFRGSDAAVLAVYQQPGANALQVGEGIKHTLEELSLAFPEGITYQIPYDSTRFIEISIEEVIETLLIAVFLVIMVVFLFLQDVRATLIPTLAIPVSLIGTFACMQILGYSINLITLFGLILAIGIVVDAAIIVLENVERLLSEGELSPRDATLQAMSEVTLPLVASALVLLAVFVPVSLMPGLTGQIFEQFGVVLSISVVLSTVVALTLAPALCVLLMNKTNKEPIWILRKFNDGIDWLTTRYTSVARILSHRLLLSGVIYVGLLTLIGTLFASLPTGFVPKEDSGAFFAEVQLPDAAAVPRTEQMMDAMVASLEDVEGVRDVISIAGFSLLDGATSSNAGVLIINLEDWSERTEPGMRQSDIFEKVAITLDGFQDAITLPFEPPTIPGLGMSAGFEFMLQDRVGRKPNELADTMDLVLDAANEAPEIALAYSTFRSSVPQVFLDVDRAQAKNAGVEIDTLMTTLQAQFGGLFVNNITMFGRRTPVTIQAESKYRDEVDDLQTIYVRNASGTLVPVSALLQTVETLGPKTLTRYNLYNAAPINGEAPPGVSSGEAVAAMQQIAAETLPAGYGYEWTGATYQEIEAGNTAVFAFALAVLFAYLFLVAQYESWTIPISILLVVPTALVGSFLMTAAAGGDINLYTQIGLVLMIGMAARNAILIVEFAKKLRDGGKSALEAAETAARLRFRPLLMTAFAFLLGVFPLVIASGAGDGSRRALGNAVFGGMISAVVIGALLTPAIYVALDRLRGNRSPRMLE